MADFIHEAVSCPHCGKESPYTFHLYIDARKQPELHARCSNGTMFDFTCPHCAKLSRIGYPMLYHDPDRKLMIYVAGERNLPEAMQAMVVGATAHDVTDAAQYTARAVTSPMQLMEKLLIFEHELDDRTIELHKSMLIPVIQEDYCTDSITGLLLMDAQGALMFAVNTKTGLLPISIPLTDEAYAQLHEQCSAFYTKDPFENLFVDAAWVERYLQPNEVLQ